MRTLEAIGVKCVIMFMLGLSVFLVKGISCAEEGKYPIRVEIIDKAQARYDTLENAYVALYSAQIKKDLEWLYETLTEESAEEIKRLFEEAGIDPIKIFDSERKEKQTFIIGKKEYNGDVLLIIEHNEKDGTTTRIPVTFIIENGQWKRTNKYADNEELHEYLDYIKPEEIISSAIKIHPDRWNLNWYNRIKEHMEEKEWIRHFAERVSILCLIGNLKDNQGTPYSVKEIVPETILLNYLLHPQPWRFKNEEKIALQ